MFTDEDIHAAEQTGSLQLVPSPDDRLPGVNHILGYMTILGAKEALYREQAIDVFLRPLCLVFTQWPGMLLAESWTV